MFNTPGINILARHSCTLGHGIEYKDSQSTYPGQWHFFCCIWHYSSWSIISSFRQSFVFLFLEHLDAYRRIISSNCYKITREPKKKLLNIFTLSLLSKTFCFGVEIYFPFFLNWDVIASLMLMCKTLQLLSGINQALARDFYFCFEILV